MHGKSCRAIVAVYYHASRRTAVGTEFYLINVCATCSRARTAATVSDLPMAIWAQGPIANLGSDAHASNHVDVWDFGTARGVTRFPSTRCGSSSAPFASGG